MLFTSYSFLIFFTLVTIVYWNLPHRFRWILLLIASIIFYSTFFPAYTLLILMVVLLNYYFGIFIETNKNDKKRRIFLVWGVISNLIILAGFKYFTFFSAIIFDAINIKPPENSLFITLVMPLGISFFTFTNISYLVEVKRRNIKAETHMGIYATFITFFPKLIQGPIERPQLFLAQVRKSKVFNYENAVIGIRMMLWGYFKKLVIADRFAIAVNSVYDSPSTQPGPIIAIATLFYAFQIYLDFSGYIDIARGAGRILGFELSPNFNRPYAAKSVKEFWSRWHITLSSWLRDYIFLPVAYSLSRKLKKDQYFIIRTDDLIYITAITLTFLICGIWHGVGWNYLVWGGLFAFYLVIAHLIRKPKKHFLSRFRNLKPNRIINTMQIITTFILICIAWIFFRSGTLAEAVNSCNGLFSGWSDTGRLLDLQSWSRCFHFSLPDLIIVICLHPFVMIVEYLVYDKGYSLRFRNFPAYIRWGSYYLLFLLILFLGKFESNSFIYFRF